MPKAGTFTISKKSQMLRVGNQCLSMSMIANEICAYFYGLARS